MDDEYVVMLMNERGRRKEPDSEVEISFSLTVRSHLALSIPADCTYQYTENGNVKRSYEFRS